MKLFRKIRQNLIKEGKLRKYLIYAAGEILLVIIGISMAFQLNNWNENRIEENTEVSYYENIKEQIEDDKSLIGEQIEYNNYYTVQFKYANEILEANDRSKMDTLGLIIRNFTQYSDFDRKGNIYETLVNSGEIKLLKNLTIVNRIRMLEEKYNYVNRMENIHYDAIMKYVVQTVTPVLKFSDASIQKPDLLYTYEFQNFVLLLIQIMAEKDEVYNEVLDEIDNITNLINNELK